MFALLMIMSLMIFFGIGFITGEAVSSNFYFDNLEKRIRAEKRRRAKNENA